MTQPPLPRRIDECIGELRSRGFFVRIWVPPIGSPDKCQVRVIRKIKSNKFFLGKGLAATLRRAVIWARKETEE